MSHLLGTNICAAHLKRPAGLMHRFTQHAGGLFTSTVVLGELYAWAYHRSSPQPLLDKIENDLLADVFVLDFDKLCAEQFGRIRGQLLQLGRTVGRLDLMIAATALIHNLTLVTHNTRDFQPVPGLRLEDWLHP
jgi:tRNA(fMet)-specific endonuclease VapC